jgi:hypothetical protein
VRLAILCVAPVLTGVLAADAPQSVPARSVDPHYRLDACDQCHVMKGGEAQPIGFPQAERICLACHDGVRAAAEAHPIDRLLEGDAFQSPGWPLLEGKLACQTCHDISLTAGHEHAETVASNFLRPVQGQGPDAFCAACHRPVQFRRVNPHRNMTPEGQVVPADCLLCHKSVPDRNAMTRQGNPDLRADVMVLCRSCHYYHVDWFEPGHMDAKVPPKMLAYMRARELTGPTTRPSRELIARLEAENARPRDWPLGPGDTVICTSCHNPHQQGVFPPGSVLGIDAMQIRGDRVVSKIPVTRTCLRCHNL